MLKDKGQVSQRGLKKGRVEARAQTRRALAAVLLLVGMSLGLLPAEAQLPETSLKLEPPSLRPSPEVDGRKESIVSEASTSNNASSASSSNAPASTTTNSPNSEPSGTSQAASSDNAPDDGAPWTLEPAGAHTSRPIFREFSAMAPDSTGRVVLFGGQGPRDDTWTWDGVHWTPQMDSSSIPPGRESHAMAYHPASKKLVLFGGGGAAGALSDTWTWDGDKNAWVEVTPELESSPCRLSGQGNCVSPPARGNAGLAQDGTGNLVLFGGGQDQNLFSDTWRWDGTRWTQLKPEKRSPSARRDIKLAYNAPMGSMGGKTILFGGGESGGQAGDTWTWDGANWHEEKPNPSPTPRSHAAIAFSESLGRTVLFGGLSGNNDTWTWNGLNWTQHHPAVSPGPAGVESGMAYHSSTKKVLILGLAQPTGNFVTGETWTWEGRITLPLNPKLPPGDLAFEILPNSIPADGVSTADATATVTADGRPLANQPVEFKYEDPVFRKSSMPGWSTAICLTDVEGRCTVKVTAGRIPGVDKLLASTPLVGYSAFAFLTLTPPAGPLFSNVSCSHLSPPEQGREGWWGSLDPGFGCGGKLATDIQGEQVLYVQSVGVIQDGTLVVLARARKEQDAREETSYLVGYRANGDLNRSFGSAGSVTVPGDGRRLLVQPNGKLLVMSAVEENGLTGSVTSIVLSRYNRDGRLDDGTPADTSPGDGFGTAGSVRPGQQWTGRVWDYPGPYRREGPYAASALGLTVDENGKIFTAGPAGDSKSILVAALNSNGSPYDFFGGDGKTLVRYSEEGVSGAGAVITDSVGRVTVGGAVVTTTGRYRSEGALARLLPNGQLDSSFNRCPSVEGPCGGTKVEPVDLDRVTDLGFQPGGRLLASGGGDVVGFKEDGQRDDGFSRITPPPTVAHGAPNLDINAETMTVQQDGKVVVSGWVEDETVVRNACYALWCAEARVKFAVARYNFDGSPDQRCGDPAFVVTRFLGDWSWGAAVTVQPDGKILSVGVDLTENVATLVVARYAGGESPPAPSEITVEGATVNEPGQGHTEAPFNVKLKLDAPACKPMAFDYATADESATAGQDYTQTKGTVMFQKGQQEQVIPVPVLPDGNPESPETFNMSVSNSVGLADPTRPKELKIPVVKLAEGQATILDPQPSKTPKKDDLPALSIADTSVIEGNQGTTTATLAVALTRVSKQKVTVDYQTQDDSATAPGDYQTEKGTITFEPGQTQKTITVQVATDLTPEPTETLHVQLQDPRAAAIVRPRGAVTVYDDDQNQPPTARQTPSAASRVPTAAGLLVPGANLPPPSLAQGTQIQAQQQIQQQAQQQAQAQLMAGVMTERQRQAEIEKAGLSDKDAYLAAARRQTSPAFAWAFSWMAALATFGAGLAYRKQTSPQPARNRRK